MARNLENKRRLDSERGQRKRQAKADQDFDKFVLVYAARCRRDGIEPTMTIPQLRVIFNLDRTGLNARIENGKRQAARNFENGKLFGVKSAPRG